MPKLVTKLTEIQALLDALAEQHKVPGASLGVMSGDDYISLVTGVSNVDTKLPVTRDTLFQIGSITKVYTATLIMRLVDEGKIDLDAPVRKYVEDFALADEQYIDDITVRQLLTHTSGIDGGDYFADFGPGDDAVELFVRSLSDLGMVHKPGEMWSYCNAGSVLAGRVIETVTGQRFRAAMHERLLGPLGLNDTSLRVEDMLVRRCATGHITLPGASEPSVTPTPLLPMSTVPAGAITVSTPTDLIAFVKMHLNDGVAMTPYLTPESARAMQEVQVKLPRYSRRAGMGIGWMLVDFGGERVYAHTGGTVGQGALLYVMPERRFAVALLTNSTGGLKLWKDLGRYLFEEFTGVWAADDPKPPADPPSLDLSKYVGSYMRRDVRLDFEVRDGALVGVSRYTGSVDGIGEPDEFTLRPFDAEMFQTVHKSGESLLEFMDFDADGRPTYVHQGRVARRT